MERHIILEHQTPKHKLSAAERQAIESRLNRAYVNGPNTTSVVSDPIIDECGGDYNLARIVMVIREQMLRNATEGRCIYRGTVWCKMGYNSISAFTGGRVSAKVARNGIAKLEKLDLIRRRVMYNAAEHKYEETMYTLSEKGMLLTGTNPELAEFAKAQKAKDAALPEQTITKAEKKAKPEKPAEKEAKKPAPSKPSKSADIEHGYVLIQRIMFPEFSPRDYKKLAAGLSEDDRRDADAAMMRELKKHGCDNPGKYIKR